LSKFVYCSNMRWTVGFDCLNCHIAKKLICLISLLWTQLIHRNHRLDVLCPFCCQLGDAFPRIQLTANGYFLVSKILSRYLLCDNTGESETANPVVIVIKVCVSFITLIPDSINFFNISTKKIAFLADY
jgi:uncharacterized membrane protein YhhN